MTRHFVLWTDADECHVATLARFKRNEHGDRYDESPPIPSELVDELGFWEWQTPVHP